MPDYSQGKIYKLTSDESECLYIGSTVKRLRDRLRSHITDIKAGSTKTHVEMQKYNNIKIELIELFPCDSKKDLEIREGYYQRQHDKILNKNVAGRSYKEWYHDNPEKIKEKRKRERAKFASLPEEAKDEIRRNDRERYADNPNADERKKKDRERYAAKKSSLSEEEKKKRNRKSRERYAAKKLAKKN